MPTLHVTATRSTADGHWILTGTCPLCSQKHTHGGGTGPVPQLGHRIAHCLNRKPGDGYHLAEIIEDPWPARLAKLVDQAKAKRAARHQLRQDHAAVRAAGLRARHARKLAYLAREPQQERTAEDPMASGAPLATHPTVPGEA